MATPRDMHFVEHTHPIDLTDWLGGVKKKTLKRVTEILIAEFTRDNPPRLSFAREWGYGNDGRGGKGPADAATIYVDLPLSADSDDNCTWACSLEGAINSVIELHERCDSEGKILGREGHTVALAIAKRLHELAKKLEDACVFEEDKVEQASDNRDVSR